MQILAAAAEDLPRDGSPSFPGAQVPVAGSGSDFRLNGVVLGFGFGILRVRRLLGFRVWVCGHLGSGGFGGLEFLGSGFF